ncbi:GD23717 [Drosophila simulans]|uniref:GD23717 n=1 Tax=Drosophila simulans TaxID=7240 RepID=B4Q9D0_DROSI|nr:GD23717 [Drosophila simulans]
MEDDLEFLINALSVPNTPLTEPYDEVQLLEMRESFKALQKILRRSSLPVEESLRSMPRSKAGGHLEALPSMLPIMDSNNERSSDKAWNSAESGARSSPIISECGLGDWDKEDPSSDAADKALVPYEELCNERSSWDTTITSRSLARRESRSAYLFTWCGTTKTTIRRARTTELSHNLQQLSEKARSTTEFIQRLKGMSDKVTESCMEFERLVHAQCEALIQAIHDRREYLLEAIRMDKDTKIRILKDQQSNCTGKLQQTTGLIQFCIEALKETDSAAFLQVGSMLINRVTNTDMTWHQEVTNAAPRVSPIVDLTLDDAALARAIDNLNFIQMRAPMTPTILPSDCSAENNSVTVAWQPPNHSFVEGYVLELDDGSGGEFREVYCGKETICTVDGLHFNSMYNARVKAFNSAGEGEYSELIGLQTAEVAWFTFDPVLSGGAGSGLIFSKNNATVSVEGWEHRVALGSVGFSRGVHYWEFTIDNYTADTDPAFGVARIDVARNKMLGKDEKSFAMYIDRQRSWFQHNSIHERRVEGGITTGSTIGVLLDLERHTLSFLVNEMPQGSVAFRDLYGVFYPAVSINRGVTLTMHTAMDAPKMDYF